MKELIKKLTPTLRELGFKGSGQNYYRIEQDTVSIVNFQKSSGGGKFYLNLGVQPLCMVPEYDDPRKLKEYECIFRDRISPPDNAQGWSYDMPEQEVNVLIGKIHTAHQQFFQAHSNIKNELLAISANELLPENFGSSKYSEYHAVTLKELSELALHYGEIYKSQLFAKQGIEVCGAQATSLVAELKKLANT